MDKSRETSDGMPEPAVAEAWQQVGASFERFCLTAGVSALRRMMEQDAVELCVRAMATRMVLPPTVGARSRAQDRLSRWQGVADAGRGCEPATARKWCFLVSWEAAQSEDPLGRWAMNLMLINV